jgi:FkbM family methyltransferase
MEVSMDALLGQVRQIDFVDVGCSGDLDEKWKGLLSLLNYTGFDPNAEECSRLAAQPHPYRTCRHLPYAIAGESGQRTMYKTESIYCYSLLKPNHPWLTRFTFGHLFRETGTEPVACTTLNELVAKEGLQADVLKLDTQGLELPILKAGEHLTRDVFCIETETGFVENYVGETTYAQVDEYLRSLGFLMFDMNMEHRIGRMGPLAKHGRHQPLWCEVVWLFDYPGRGVIPTREKALRALRLCRAMGYFDYGCELSRHFGKAGVLTPEETASAESVTSWTG